MSSSLTASMQARRHPETTHIDRLATADMLAMLHQDDKRYRRRSAPVCRISPG